jgi:hypothetical protein
MILLIGTCVVSGSVSHDTTSHWTNGTLCGLIQGDKGRNIFSGDGTVLFHSLMPDKSLHMKGESCQGGKESDWKICKDKVF